MRDFVGRDPLTGVAHINPHQKRFATDRRGHQAARWRVPHRVTQQIADDLFEPLSVSAGLGRVILEFGEHLHLALSPGQRRGRLDQSLDHRPSVGWLQPHREAPNGGLRQREQVVDELL